MVSEGKIISSKGNRLPSKCKRYNSFIKRYYTQIQILRGGLTPLRFLLLLFRRGEENVVQN